MHGTKAPLFYARVEVIGLGFTLINQSFRQLDHMHVNIPNLYWVPNFVMTIFSDYNRCYGVSNDRILIIRSYYKLMKTEMLLHSFIDK